MVRALLPPRPYVPPLLLFALALWLVVLLAFTLLRQFCAEYYLIVVIVATGLGLALLAAEWRYKWPLGIVSALLGACMGLALVSLWCAQFAQTMDDCDGVWGSFRIECTADAAQGSYGSSVEANACFPDGSTHAVRVSLSDGDILPRYGDVATVWGHCTKPDEATSDYYWNRGLSTKLYASKYTALEPASAVALLATLRNAAIDKFNACDIDDGGLSLALLCGWRQGLSEELYQAFQVCGLAHIVAVSGAHLAIIVGLVSVFMRALPLPRSCSSLIEFTFVLGYVVFAAAPISALRSAVMVIFLIFARFAKRRNASLNSLAACITGFIIIDPTTAISVSFALSALSTLGIVVFAPLINSWLAPLKHLPAFISQSLALTLASSLLAMPLSAAIFSKLPLISLLANVAAAPFFAPVCGLALVGALGASVFGPPAGFLVALAKLAAQAFGALVNLLSCIPFASIPFNLATWQALVLTTAAALLLYLTWPRAKAIAISLSFASVGVCAVLAAMLLPAIFSNEIVMLDVGQGDSFLLRSRGKCILVDTGNQDTKLHQALARQRVGYIDAILVSHSDDDHMGSLASLKGVVVVGCVYLSAGTWDCGCANCETLLQDASALVGAANVRPVMQGTDISFGCFNLLLLEPAAFSDDGGNADSQCWRVEADVDDDAQVDWTALFVGDAEVGQLDAMNKAGKLGHYDIYKLGHHGSKNALTSDLAGVLCPKITLVSVGENNRYGHPNAKILAYLSEVGSKVYRSDTRGDVCCKLYDDHIEVRCER